MENTPRNVSRGTFFGPRHPSPMFHVERKLHAPAKETSAAERETKQCFTWNMFEQRILKSASNTHNLYETTSFALQKHIFSIFAAKLLSFAHLGTKQLQMQSI
jgi:hypothetical protein